jgi:hypothetical protein
LAYGRKKGYGPPVHAPANGHQAKYTYRYYPTANVYFDVGRHLYFYKEGQHWRVSASLPRHLRVRLDLDYVIIEMSTDKPYTHQAIHKEKHPPGQTPKYETAKKSQYAEKSKKY